MNLDLFKQLFSRCLDLMISFPIRLFVIERNKNIGLPNSLVFQDVIDMSKANWKMRFPKQAKTPKPLEQVHKEAHQEEVKKQMQFTVMPQGGGVLQGPQGGGGGGGRRKDDRRNRE